MSISSLNSNLAALVAQLNIGTATSSVQNNVTALSSGNRIVNASTDVAALSTGTALASQVSALNTAITVSSQASSLLQVADGALAQIQTILQRQQTIAASAQSGSLSDTQRGFLDQEFQTLTTQIDQLASTTNFNGVNLLNGSIAGGTNITTNSNAGNANQSVSSSVIATVGNSGAFTAGDTFTVNGVTLALKVTGGVDLSGSTIQDAAANVVAALNNSGSPALADYRFSSDASANITATYIGKATSAIPGFSASANVASSALGTVAAATFGTGTTIGTYANTIAAADTTTINGVAITFGASAGQVAVGANNTATLANLATFLNSATFQAANPAIAGVTYSSDATHLYGAYSGTSSPTFTSIATIAANGFTGVAGVGLKTQGETGLGAGSFTAVGTIQGSGLFVTNTGGASVTNYGQAVDLSNINSNSAFAGNFGGTGTIGKITANYIGGSTPGVSFSVKVGNDTYTTAAISNATLASTTAPVALTFTGTNTTSGAVEGGSFTLNLQPQTAITNQGGADQLASAINTALSQTSVYQNRSVLSYNNNFSAQVGSTLTGTLKGSSISFNSNTFANTLVSAVSVSSPSTGTTDAKISITLGGQTFSTNAGLGSTLATSKVITLTNTSNPSQTITLTTGTTTNGTTGVAADLSNSTNAAAFQTALSNALGITSANAALSFQVGSTSSASIGVSIGSATTSSLYGGQALDVKTLSDASAASNALSTALNTVTSLRATVGALEEGFNYATAAATSAAQNEGAAKSNLLDTDVAATSTQFATAQVQLQAGIAVLAQANQLQQALLKLVG